MSLLAEIQQRHKSFHATIAERAALVTQPIEQGYSIPNTPFGVKKPKREWIKESDYWHLMWCFDLVRERPFVKPRVSVRTIQIAVCMEFGCSLAEMLGSGRTPDIVLPRHVAMFLTKRLIDLSLPAVGRKFGGRDHTTALSAIRRIERLIVTKPDLAETVRRLADLLGGRIA